jgi:AcrR family transcriptional regulator
MIRRRAARGEGELLHGEILAAASALLAETGQEEAVSVRAVAERVGVTPPSIYLHFADKGELLAAVCAQVFAEFDQVMAAAAASTADPVQALERQGIAYVDFARQRPEHYRLMFMSRPPPGVAGPTDAELTAVSGLARVIAAVTEAQAAGRIAIEDPGRVAMRLWMHAHGLASLLIAKSHFPWGDTEELVRRTLRASLLGVAAESWAPDSPLPELLTDVAPR